MSRNDSRISLSPSERAKVKSRSSSRSQRATPNIVVQDDERPRSKVSSRGSQRNPRDVDPSKRSESAASNRSNKNGTPTSPNLKKQRTSIKTPTSPTLRNRLHSKRKKSFASVSDSEKKQISEQNDSEYQNHSTTGLAIVPPEIFQMTTLRRLILSNNNISGLSPAIGNLVNLEYLDISLNPLIVRNGHDDYSCLPKEFRYLKNLLTLNLRECRLQHIPVVVWSMVSLETLDLSRNKVGFIMSELGNLPALRHLRLSHMNLDTLPAEIGFCNRLETLDLLGNPIDNLPETLVECRILHHFTIDFRNFYKLLDPYMLKLIEEGKIRSEHIPQVVFEVENLRILDLSWTKNNSFAQQHTLMSLTELYLLHNTYFDIPEALCMLNQLKLLDMSYNRINSIPEYFQRLTNLEVFIMKHNKLTILSRNLSRLPSLQKLIVDHNFIHTIEKEISENRSLRILDASHNALSSISDELCSVEQLETLDLRYNKISTIPLSIRRLINLKGMNSFSERTERIGLHLSGNRILEPTAQIWKSKFIETLFDYLEKKEKDLSKSYFHLKLILIGAKNSGKTRIAQSLVEERKSVVKQLKTLENFVSIVEENRIVENVQQQLSSQISSNNFSDQWIENRISPNDEQIEQTFTKTRRTFPAPLKTYRSAEKLNLIYDKSLLVTRNNLYCVIVDFTFDPTYEILYPMFYDPFSHFIIPINFSSLINHVETALTLNQDQNSENVLETIDLNFLLNENWFDENVFRFVSSICDHSERSTFSILCHVDHRRNEEIEKVLFERIRSKIEDFLSENGRNEQIEFDWNCFPRTYSFDEENFRSNLIERLEATAIRRNFVHHKAKRDEIRRRLSFIPNDSLVVDFETSSKQFENEKLKTKIILNDVDDAQTDDSQNDSQFSEQIEFDQCVDFLRLTGDFLLFEQRSQKLIILRPFHLFNRILALTIFRAKIDQWFDYENNMLFRFTGFYRNFDSFQIDRQRLLERGEFTWKTLQILFFEQNNDRIGLTEQNIINYCRLFERLYLGFLNQSNYQDGEVSMIHFVCPWFLKEKTDPINAFEYFENLERIRRFDLVRIERARQIKQQQLWFSIDVGDDPSKENTTQFPIPIPELPKFHEIQVFEAQVFKRENLKTIRISMENRRSFPRSFYPQILICFHSLFHERLDYENLTLARTVDKNLIEMKKDPNETCFQLTTNGNFIERIKNVLNLNIFPFYPTIVFRIENETS